MKNNSLKTIKELLPQSLVFSKEVKKMLIAQLQILTSKQTDLLAKILLEEKERLSKISN